MYEALSETEFAPALVETAFIPNVFIDVSKYQERKLEVMKVYDSEIMPDNFPRSINAMESLAGFRGSRICVKYAECFMLIFEQL
jgi:LmbE family N-acetylglucosaminyl deacetylase